MGTNVGLAAALSLGLMAGSASAQNNESRGYGGPLYVGPNFQQGGQYTTPDFSKKPGKKSVTIKRETAKVRKQPQKREVATEREKTPAAEKETTAEKADTGALTSTTTGMAASSEPVTCKKFDPTSGQTTRCPAGSDGFRQRRGDAPEWFNFA